MATQHEKLAAVEAAMLAHDGTKDTVEAKRFIAKHDALLALMPGTGIPPEPLPPPPPLAITTDGQLFSAGGDAQIDCSGKLVRVTHKANVWSCYPYRWNAPAAGIKDGRISGGAMVSDVTAEERWNGIYPKADGRWAVFVRAEKGPIKGLTVSEFRAHGCFDGVGINGGPGGEPEGAVVEDSWFSLVRDDCIEHDCLKDIKVRRCLVDGCFVFLSQRNHGVKENRNELLSITEECRIHMQQMNGADTLPNPSYNSPFKLSSNAPRQRFIDNILRADHPRPYGQSDPLFDWKNDKLKHLREQVKGNIFVWGGAEKYGSYQSQWGDPPDGWEVTEDLEVWFKERAAWIAAHPAVLRIPGHDME